MITIRKAVESDAQDIFDIRSRAIVDKCSAYYSEEQLSIWTQGGMSDGFISDVVQTFHVSEVDGRVIGSGKINIEPVWLMLFLLTQIFPEKAQRSRCCSS